MGVYVCIRSAYKLAIIFLSPLHPSVSCHKIGKSKKYTPSLASLLKQAPLFSHSINTASGINSAQWYLGSKIQDASGISSKEQSRQSHSRKGNSADIQLGHK
jgi:hypothetical protein